jgi:hypothetical protein
MLEAIAGIPVMDHFEVNLFPMKIQLEREVGKRLFDYMFPGSSDSKTKSPFMVKNMQPVDDNDEEANTGNSSQLTLSGTEKLDSARAGSLELRLYPTMNSESRPRTAVSQKSKGSSPPTEGHHFRLFQSNGKNSSSSRFSSTKTLGKKASAESLQSSTGSRPTLGRASTINSLQDSQSVNSETKSKRFGIHRNGNKKKEQPSDDLTKMMSRASEYMTLAYVKIPSVVLCLS